MSTTNLIIVDQSLRRYWDDFTKDRPQVSLNWRALLCTSLDQFPTLLDEVIPENKIVVITVLNQVLPEVVTHGMVPTTTMTATTDFLNEVRKKATTTGDCIVRIILFDLIAERFKLKNKSFGVHNRLD